MSKKTFISFMLSLSFALVLFAATDNNKAMELIRKGNEAYLAAKDPGKAATYFKKAVDLASGSVKVEALLKTAYMSHVQGQKVQAYQDLINEALRIDPGTTLAPKKYRASFRQVFADVKGRAVMNKASAPAATAATSRKAPQKALKAKASGGPKLFVALSYAMGLSETSKEQSWTEPLYGESITYDLASRAGKSANIGLGVGYNLNPSMGVGLGAIILSNDLNASLNAGVPHPYVFNAPRTATGAYVSDLKATIIYLNFIYRVSVSKFTVDLFAGPAYFNSSADIINTIAIQDVFPNTSVTMTLATENVKKSSFGFNAGAGLNYFFAKSLGVFVEARYLSGNAAFAPSSGTVPEITLPIGGLSVGGGLIFRF